MLMEQTKKGILLVSAIAFFAVCSSANAFGLGICIFALLCIELEKAGRTIPRKEYKRFVRNFSICMCCCLLVHFYFTWIPSSKLAWIANQIHVSSSMLLLSTGLFAIIISYLFIQNDVSVLIGKGSCENCDQKRINKGTLIICMGLAVFGIVTMSVFSLSPELWGDEEYSLWIVEYSYRDIVKITANDVHPPLYYFILKTWITCVQAILGADYRVFAAKVCSIIPYVLLFLIGITTVRKRWQGTLSAIFTAAIITMPNMTHYGVEIRMYSWGMLFVTLAYMALYNVVKKGKIINWLAFSAASLAAAYTHYFACVAVSGLYFVLFIWVAWKNRKDIIKWFVSAFMTFMGFLPWLTIVIKQLKSVEENYWISEIKADTVHEFFAFILDNGYLFYIMAIVVAMGIIRMMEMRLFQWEDAYWLTGILVPFWTMAIGMGASIIVRPVFVSRYLLPSMGCFWLGLIGFAVNSSNAQIIKRLSQIVMAGGMMNLLIFAVQEIPGWMNR